MVMRGSHVILKREATRWPMVEVRGGYSNLLRQLDVLLRGVV